ncbi:hypothetical protein Y1Q_0003474 [Alligator mississippiensis]|uniref:Uncharacterized protein n=1 Tax=Alligator mississippiensis TaxID=8496 RepID=A0A151M478_ALLMI|nr:hypothetical protein Y1Q_0003474 [Alligator mississippiensis]
MVLEEGLDAVMTLLSSHDTCQPAQFIQHLDQIFKPIFLSWNWLNPPVCPFGNRIGLHPKSAEVSAKSPIHFRKQGIVRRNHPPTEEKLI